MVVKNNYYWINEDSGMDFIANGEMAEVFPFMDMKSFMVSGLLMFASGLWITKCEIDCKYFWILFQLNRLLFHRNKKEAF
jgi:hypothetical protein